MADHDPLCPGMPWTESQPWAVGGCMCDEYARVRADERATAQVQACDAHISQVAVLREQIATEIEEYGGPPQCDCEVCRYCYWSRAIEGAARIARGEGVKRG